MLHYPYSGSIVEYDRSGNGIGISGLYPPSYLGYFHPPNDIWAVTRNENKEVSDQNFDQSLDMGRKHRGPPIP
jgi:hypothetical protein